MNKHSQNGHEGMKKDTRIKISLFFAHLRQLVKSAAYI